MFVRVKLSSTVSCPEDLSCTADLNQSNFVKFVDRRWLKDTHLILLTCLNVMSEVWRRDLSPSSIAILCHPQDSDYREGKALGLHDTDLRFL